MRAARIFLLTFAFLLAAAFAQGSAGEILAGVQEQPGLLGSIAKDWQVYTVAVMLLMAGLVALAYAIANSFSLPDLRAWADVELGEIFASALLLMFIIGIISFIDVSAAGILGPSFPSSCEKPGFCPANIASDYLDSYLKAANSAYRTTMVNSIDTANDAFAGSTVGIQDLIYGYLTYRFRDNPEKMIQVEMYDQVLQNLSAVLASLGMQKFMLKFMTFSVAPVAIFLGIVLRSFFLTRKMGGLLLAFGLGFLVVYPLTYALAWYTLDAAIYGAQKGPSGTLNPCPKVCLPFSKVVDLSETPLVEVPMETVREDFHGQCMAELESDGIGETGRSNTCMDACRDDVDSTGRSDSCMDGCTAGIDSTGRSVPCMDGCMGQYFFNCQARCAEQCTEAGYEMPAAEFPDPAVVARWEECMDPCMEAENCDATGVERTSYCQANECPVVIGELASGVEYCQATECGVLPGYTGEETAYCEGQCTPLEGFGGSSEEYCDHETDGMVARLGRTGGVAVGSGADYHSYGYCPVDPCGFPIPYQKKECLGYTGTPNICNTRPFQPDDPAYAMMDASELVDGCPAECRTLAPMAPGAECFNRKSIRQDDGTYKYEPLCPSQCMWITTGGETDRTCPDECREFYPAHPQELWDAKASDQTCVYIIPDVVFDEPDTCSQCAFVAEKGLTMEPAMIWDCTAFCGAPSSTVMGQDPATMTNNIGGMQGPTDVIAVSKLMVPAFVLPIFCLAVTLMFVMSLSPMLGGDIDIPGMMRMMQ
jgi:hypothetical protein